MKYIPTILASITLLFCSNCGWFNKEVNEKPAQVLIQDGMDNYEEGHYSTAIENFEQLRDWYPFSRYAILAELKIADAHYQIEQYSEAIAAYEEFEQLHPRNEAIPYVIYQIGQSYYDQIDSVDRDQTAAQEAVKVYRRLIRQFPDDPYANLAKVHTIKCFQSMAGHDLYVGKFYYKNKRYKAARQRFLAVINNYPDMGVHHQALLYIAACDALIAHATAPNT